jgi:hypothetical protein
MPRMGGNKECMVGVLGSSKNGLSHLQTFCIRPCNWFEDLRPGIPTNASHIGTKTNARMAKRESMALDLAAVCYSDSDPDHRISGQNSPLFVERDFFIDARILMIASR